MLCVVSPTNVFEKEVLKSPPMAVYSLFSFCIMTLGELTLGTRRPLLWGELQRKQSLVTVGQSQIWALL